MTSPKAERYLTTGEVAQLLAVAKKTIAKWADDRKLPCMRTLGGHRRFPASLILAIRDQLTTRPPTGGAA